MKFIPNLSLVTLGSRIRAGTTAFKTSVNYVTVILLLMLLFVNFTLVQSNCEWSETETNEGALALLQHFPLSILNSNETPIECPSTRINIKIRKCPPNQNASESTKSTSFSKNDLNTTWQLISLNCSSSQPVTWNIYGNLKSELIQSVDLEQKYVGQNNSFVYSATVNTTVSVGDAGLSGYTLTCEHRDNKCPSQKSMYFYGKQSNGDLKDTQLIINSHGFGNGVDGSGIVPERSNQLEINLEFSNSDNHDSKCQSFVCTYSSRSNSTVLGNNAHSEESSESLVSVSMAVIKCTNPVHCKFVMSFLDTTGEIDGDYLLNARETNVLSIPGSYTSGVVLCRTNDKTKYQYVQFYRSVDEAENKILLYDDQNQDGNYLQPSEMMKIDVTSVTDSDSGSAHYTGIHISCKFSNFLFAKGSNYILKNYNATILTHPLVEKEKTYTNMKSELVSRVTDCPKDVTSIICRAPLWNSDEWVNLTYSVSSPAFINDSIEIWDLYDTDTEPDITLVCEAENLPLAEIAWYKGGRIVPHGHGYQNYSTTNKSTISLLHFNRNMKLSSIAGEYSCNASNYFGEAAKKFTIKVTSHPLQKYLVVSLGSMLLITIITLSIYLYYFWKQSNIDKDKIKDLLKEFYKGVPLSNEDDPVNDSNEERRQSNTGERFAFSLAYDKEEYEINPNNLECDPKNLSARLGFGHYGTVIEGRLHIRSYYSKAPVAVKILKEINPANVKNLLEELKVLMYINEGRHENIVGLIGAVTKNSNGNIQIVMELCEGGSLKTFFERNKGAFHEFNPETHVPNHPTPISSYVKLAIRLTTSDLIRWSLQLARGMKYLAWKKIIHGDLAIRNILLTSSGDVKITDFGLSKKLKDGMSNYVKKPGSPNSNKFFPVEILSPEVLRNEIFSTQSDVWAFGITLWEIFSLGERPYAKFSRNWAYFEDQVCNKKYRLPCPRYASPEIYSIMEKCWDENPDNRPTFEDLFHFFEHLSVSVPPNKQEKQPPGVQIETEAESWPPPPIIHPNGYQARPYNQLSETIAQPQAYNNQQSRAAPAQQLEPINLHNEYLPMTTFRQPVSSPPAPQSQPFHIVDGYLDATELNEVSEHVTEQQLQVNYNPNRGYVSFGDAQSRGFSAT